MLIFPLHSLNHWLIYIDIYTRIFLWSVYKVLGKNTVGGITCVHCRLFFLSSLSFLLKRDLEALVLVFSFFLWGWRIWTFNLLVEDVYVLASWAICSYWRFRSLAWLFMSLKNNLYRFLYISLVWWILILIVFFFNSKCWDKLWSDLLWIVLLYTILLSSIYYLDFQICLSLIFLLSRNFLDLHFFQQWRRLKKSLEEIFIRNKRKNQKNQNPSSISTLNLKLIKI